MTGHRVGLRREGTLAVAYDAGDYAALDAADGVPPLRRARRRGTRQPRLSQAGSLLLTPDVHGGVLITWLRSKQGYDLAAEVLHLKRHRNAIILAHNYQVPEIQDLADFVGDSLGLSYKAKDTDADVIVFCGVHFMAETAKIINPGKTVILPDLDAGCSLSESCPAESLEKFLQQHADKNYYVIAYINCSAGVKALSDIICTSGNAVKVVENAPADRNILFVPDQNLGSWVMEKTGRKMDLWRGACYVHVEFTKNSIGAIREQVSRGAGGCSSGVYFRRQNVG